MIYLDNAATTFPKFYRSNFKIYKTWFNSNSFYAEEAKRILKDNQEIIKKCLKVNDGIILYFRCATEAIQWLANQKDKFSGFCCVKESHDSVYNLKNNNDGEATTLFCEQLVNQITGDVFYLTTDKSDLKNVFYGCDYTAAIGHTILPNNPKYDFIFFSGHKFHTEKGIGAMWISDNLAKYLNASNNMKNQYDLVHGTLDVAGTTILAQAMKRACSNIEALNKKYKSFVDTLLKFLNNNGIACNLIARNYNTKSNAINCLYFKELNCNALATYLSSKEIYVSTAQSACSNEQDNRVITALGFDEKIASNCLRISFSEDTNKKEIKTLCEEIIKFKQMF